MARVLTCYYRPKPGGFCKRLFRAIGALLERGHEVHYLAVVPFPVRHPNCHFHRFPWPAGHTDGLLFWALFHFIAPLQLLLIGLREGVTHAFVFGANYGLMLQPLRIVKRIPVMLLLRGDALKSHMLKGRPGWLLCLEHGIEGLAIAGQCVYGVSQTLITQIVMRHSYFRPKESGVLPNDVEIVEPKQSPTVVAKPLRASCVGTLDAGKNQALMIRSVAQLSPGDVQLSIYGVGHLEGELRELVGQLGIADRVTFMGWVDSEEIWRNSDLLLFPSLHEGAPNAVLEALARQVPVLASDIPEHRELLSCDQLLPLTAPQAWTEMINALANDPQRLKVLRAEQAQAAGRLRFDWDARVCGCILGGGS